MHHEIIDTHALFIASLNTKACFSFEVATSGSEWFKTLDVHIWGELLICSELMLKKAIEEYHKIVGCCWRAVAKDA